MKVALWQTKVIDDCADHGYFDKRWDGLEVDVVVQQRDAVTKRHRTECKTLSGNGMSSRSNIARSASPCLATRFRREATSHEVRDNRNPTQAPGAARSVGRKTPPDDSARKGATKNSRSSARIKVDVISTDEQSVRMEESIS